MQSIYHSFRHGTDIIERSPIYPIDKSGFFHGAENRGRTDTKFPSRDFKSLASAYSAIPAKKSGDTYVPPLEAPPRFELGHIGFADLCLTTWPWCHIAPFWTTV